MLGQKFHFTIWVGIATVIRYLGKHLLNDDWASPYDRASVSTWTDRGEDSHSRRNADEVDAKIIMQTVIVRHLSISPRHVLNCFNAVKLGQAATVLIMY